MNVLRRERSERMEPPINFLTGATIAPRIQYGGPKTCAIRPLPGTSASSSQSVHRFKTPQNYFPALPKINLKNTPFNGGKSTTSVNPNNKTKSSSRRNVSFSGNATSSRSRITPGSAVSNNSTNEPYVIVAITEGRCTAKGEVGIAAVDLKSPHLMLCQLSDTHSYMHTLTKLNYLNPSEVIVPHTFNSGSNVTELYKLIRNNFRNVRLNAIQRRNFSDKAGLLYIKNLSIPEYANIQLQIMHKFYALTATAALLRYIENMHFIIYAPHTLKIEFHGSQTATIIDIETTVRLELVESLSGISNRRNCLLSILNYTHTGGGLRKLRANILQPLNDEQTINNRLDCIEELLQNNDGLMPALQRVMRQFYDVDKVLWLCMQSSNQDNTKAGDAQLKNTLQLKTTLDMLPSLIDALQMSKGRRFHHIKHELEDERYVSMLEKIKTVLHDDAHINRGAFSHFQRCFAIRPNINGLLDVARRTYSELITDLQEKVAQLSDQHGLPLRLNNNISKGFFVILSTAKNKNTIVKQNLPDVFIEINQHGNTITMTTKEIMVINQQAQEALDDIQGISNLIIGQLLNELRSNMSLLYKLCENIFELDMILSLAQVSSAGNYVRPRFNKYLELKDSIHPILDSVMPTSPIPNDVFASPEFNFNIITGPNMGGKTIYIKQVALLQIMAQIGCFVPATKATFRIASNIFSRMGFNDSIECNASTYVLEMKEMQYILQTLTPTSLIIIDELCRGTSCKEGTSMAWVICEQLLNSKAFTFFTTHFLYLSKLEDFYLNVANLHAETVVSDNPDDNGGLIYKYKILPGIVNIEHYGLALAKKTNLPKTVIDLAEDLIKIISNQKKPLSGSSQTIKKENLIYKYIADLIQLTRSRDLSPEELTDSWNRFKAEHPEIVRGKSITTNESSKLFDLNTESSVEDNVINKLDQTVVSNEPLITPIFVKRSSKILNSSSTSLDESVTPKISMGCNYLHNSSSASNLNNITILTSVSRKTSNTNSVSSDVSTLSQKIRYLKSMTSKFNTNSTEKIFSEPNFTSYQ